MELASGSDGQWIAGALERRLSMELWDESLGTVAATIPDNFQAYARIFHRMDGGRDLDRRWADLARARGTRLHPAAQFHRLAQTGLYQDAVVRGEGGVEYWRPRQGELDEGQLLALTALLGGHTAGEQDIFQAVWVGWGGFEPGSGSIPSGRGQALTVANGLRKYWVFRGSLGELAHPPWFDDGLGFSSPTANLAWPADRSWCLATEIDFDSTLVGGTAELVDAVVHSEVLEALQVTPSTDLSSEGDVVNSPQQ